MSKPKSGCKKTPSLVPSSRELTVKQLKFLQNKIGGMSSNKAAMQAGYAPSTARKANRDILKSVKERMEQALEQFGLSEELLGSTDP
jgi:hypothetical protein